MSPMQMHELCPCDFAWPLLKASPKNRAEENSDIESKVRAVRSRAFGALLGTASSAEFPAESWDECRCIQAWLALGAASCTFRETFVDLLSLQLTMN